MNGDEIRDFNFDIKWRKGDIGFVAKSGSDRTPEIVVYQRINDIESCYTIAFFERTKEGYDLRTVGTRLSGMVEEGIIDIHDFHSALKEFHEILDRMLYLEKIMNERY